MKKSSICAAVLLAAAALAGSTPALAQQVDTSQPVVVKQKPAKALWLKAEVVHADANSMIVREEANSLMIHTFTYSEKVHAEMETILANGGYQSGDKVKIQYMPGQTVALEIKGRPSKAL